jgi:CIC family chloride channel protein
LEQTNGTQSYGKLSLRLLGLAVVSGCVAGTGAIVFRAMIGLIHNLAFFGRFSFAYDANLHTSPSPFGPAIILVPVAGALGVAWLVQNFAPEAKGHGVPEVIYSIYYKHGRIRPAVALVKSLASALSIGSGGSVGREGPIIQIGAAFGSTLAQWTRLPEWQRTTLIACGAGGGIAATFNTPLGGVLFAVELIMTEISARTLVPVVLAVVTAIIIGRLYFGDHPSFLIRPLDLQVHLDFSPDALLAYLVLGVLVGLGSLVMIRAIYRFEDLFERMPGNYYSRHYLGMALVGLLMYALQARFGHYYVQGVGYATIQDILDGALRDPGLLLLLLAAKLLATSLTLGSGASGGVFSPSLFLGACLGAAYAYLAQTLLPGLPLNPVVTAVIAMGGMVAGSTGAALTAMVMIMEMTREYQTLLSLMVVVGTAYGMRRLLMQDSIYTMKLSRRDQPVPQSLHTAILFLRSVADLADTPVREAENPATGSARVHQVLRRQGVIAALWPAGVPEPVPALALAPDTLVLDAVGFLRAVGAEAVVITAKGDPTGPALGALSLADISRHGHLPPAYLEKAPKRP